MSTREPNEYEVQAALDYVWAKAKARNSYPDDTVEEAMRTLWMGMARDETREILEYAYSHERIRTLENHLDGWAPSHLQHHLWADHVVPDDVRIPYDLDVLNKLHRELHEAGQSHENVIQP